METEAVNSLIDNFYISGRWKCTPCLSITIDNEMGFQGRNLSCMEIRLWVTRALGDDSIMQWWVVEHLLLIIWN